MQTQTTKGIISLDTHVTMCVLEILLFILYALQSTTTKTAVVYEWIKI